MDTLTSACPRCGHNNRGRDFCGGCNAYLGWDDDDLARAAVHEEEGAFDEPVLLTLADPAGLRVEPGQTVATTARIRNQSGIVDAYEVRLHGLPEGWWSVSPAVVHLLPFGADDVLCDETVEIRVHPPRIAEARAGSHTIRVTAASETHDRDVAAADMMLAITPFERVESGLAPARGRGRRRARFRLPVRNLGNAPVTVRLGAEDEEQRVRFGFRPRVLTLPAGGEACVTVSAQARAKLVGRDRERRFTTRVEAGEAVLTAGAVFVQRPWLSKTVLTVARVVTALVAAALLTEGALMPWTSDDQLGSCLHGDDDCVRYDLIATSVLAFLDEMPGVGDLSGPVSLLTSPGGVVLALAGLVLIGLRTAACAWLAGVVAVALALVLALVTGDSGEGLWLTVAGGVLCLLAGALTSLARTELS